MLLKVVPVAVACVLALASATTASANPSSQSWERSAEIAFKAADKGDWDTVIINLNRAIASNPSECLNNYYRELLQAARAAKDSLAAGGSEKVAHQRYRTRTAELEEDCVPYH